MSCPSFGINASTAAIAECRRQLDAIGLGCSSRWARDCNGLRLQPSSSPDPVRPADHVDLTGIGRPRKPYAVAPLGALPTLAEPIPPARADSIAVANHYHITNLGTLLDVLA